MKQMECLRYIVENSQSIEPKFMKISTNYDKTRIFMESQYNSVLIPDAPEGTCEHIAKFAAKYIEDHLKYNNRSPYSDILNSILNRISDEIISTLFNHVEAKSGKKRKDERELLSKMRHCIDKHIRNDVEKTRELVLRLYKYSLSPTPENIKTIKSAIEITLKGSL